MGEITEKTFTQWLTEWQRVFDSGQSMRGFEAWEVQRHQEWHETRNRVKEELRLLRAQIHTDPKRLAEALNIYASFSRGPQQRPPEVEKPLAALDMSVRVAVAISDEVDNRVHYWWGADHCYMCGPSPTGHSGTTFWSRCTQCNSPICSSHRRFIGKLPGVAGDTQKKGGLQCFCDNAEACYERRLVIQGVMEKHPWVDIRE